jgi:hypothetical protein
VENDAANIAVVRWTFSQAVELSMNIILTFGYGLGDLIYCIFLWLMTIAFAVFVFLKNKSSKLSIIGTIVLAYFGYRVYIRN